MVIVTTDLSRPGAAHVESYWAATGGPELTDCVPVNGDIDTDIAIIGGGYTGLSAAYHLARDYGIKARVLDAHRIGWGCSGRNGGFASIGVGKDDVADWVARWGLDRAKAVFEMGREAVRLVDRILDSEAIDAERSLSGGLELAHRPNRMPGLVERAKELSAFFGIETEILGPAELKSGYLDSREAHGALLHHEGFALHALRYARGLARAAQRHGARLHGASPVTGWRKEGAVHLLQTPGGIVRARQVLIATNGYTGDRLNGWTAGRTLPVLSNIIVTRPLTQAERDSVSWKTTQKIWDSRRLLFYYRLLPDQRILFGARGGIEDTPAEHRYRKAWLERRLRDMFPPLADLDTDYFWHGWVCLSFDKNPHVGTTDDSSVHYALAYMGSGVALATLCGKLVASRIGGDPTVDYGALLGSPLPRFPFPALRRFYQRLAYAYFGFQDERL